MFERQQAWAAIKTQVFPFLAAVLQGGKRWLLTIRPETRTEAQNRLMWPMLTAFSKQLEWPVNGRMVPMEPDVSIHTRHYWRVKPHARPTITASRLLFQSTPAITGG